MTRPAPVPAPNGCFRIALTGGPGGGKTTAGDLFRREMGGRIAFVQEAATLVFSGGFPRSSEPGAIIAAQRAIFQVQQNLEAVQAALHPGRILLCDRGTVDGAAYWPGEPEEFFAEMGTTLEAELARYDAVLFFESAAAGGMSIEGGNPVRTETRQEAVRLDARLRALWARHPGFHLVPHQASFFKKISHGLALLEEMVLNHDKASSPPPSKPAHGVKKARAKPKAKTPRA